MEFGNNNRARLPKNVLLNSIWAINKTTQQASQQATKRYGYVNKNNNNKIQRSHCIVIVFRPPSRLPAGRTK